MMPTKIVVTRRDLPTRAQLNGTQLITTIRGGRGRQGEAGADGDETYGAIFGEYQVNMQPGLVSDDIGGGAVGTAGVIEINQKDRTGTNIPLGEYFAGVKVGGLVQVWWDGGRRVYERTAGELTIGFDLSYGLTYQVPVTLRYKTASLPAAGTAVKVTVLPAKAAPDRPVFAFTLETPTTKYIAWGGGSVTINSLVTTLAGDGIPDVTLSVNEVPVSGWTNITAVIGSGTTNTPDDPVVLANGDVLKVEFGGDGTGLGFFFWE